MIVVDNGKKCGVKMHVTMNEKLCDEVCMSRVRGELRRTIMSEAYQETYARYPVSMETSHRGLRCTYELINLFTLSWW